jgi:probable HAF family extracellular repeat protein
MSVRSRLFPIWTIAFGLGSLVGRNAAADAIQYRVTDLGTTTYPANAMIGRELVISDSGVVSIAPTMPYYTGPIPNTVPQNSSELGPFSSANATAAAGVYTVGDVTYQFGKNIAFISNGTSATSLGLGPSLGSLHAFASIPEDVNRSGVVVGVLSAGLPVPFMWTSARGFVLLTAPGAGLGEATGINDAGQIVGWNSNTYNPGRAFLFENGKFSDLNTLIPPSTNLTLIGANDINSSGQIVAIAVDSAGKAHEVVLNPVPEPASVIVFGGIVVACGIWRRRSASSPARPKHAPRR